MSRIGSLPVEIPEGVEVTISDKNLVSVKGPLGELEQQVDKSITVKKEESSVVVTRQSEQKEHKSLHGLYRSLISNMITGVKEGFKKELELIGVGYRAANQGQILELSIGYSHTIMLQLPEEIKLETVTKRGKPPTIKLESHDKQLIGHYAAKIRSLRKPEPYKGKGIKYAGEYIRRKAGKAAAKA
ncbi:MAG TPA: 50S ribosomal protein L6 [Flavobacteriales bacterium]|nr:50S ribosomal protein L6 [Flavobacteriales bacterium]